MKILVADTLSPVGAEWLKSQEDVDLDMTVGLSPAELAEVIGQYDGMIVRSGVKVTAEALAKPGRLRCIARAGVGVDNIDVSQATASGVLVMNTPDANTLSTAELTLTLMMALSRNVAAANTSLREGSWNRKAFQGTQLAGKVLGVVGMGRIGRAVAARAAAMQMNVLCYDPFFADRAEGQIQKVGDLSELCRRADYITVHTPRTEETIGMIGPEQLAAMKPSVRLINCARGGIIDESALLEALKEGRVAGVGLDVYSSEPPESDVLKELIAHRRVLAVPHLGALTAEAQEQVALQAARQLVEVLRGGQVRNAVNAPGFDQHLPAIVRAYNELAMRMGTILSCITPGSMSRAQVTYRGAIAEMNHAPVTTSLLVGILRPHMDQPVNVINAPVLASQRGLKVERITSNRIDVYTSLMEVTVFTDRMRRSAVGTVLSDRLPRVIAIDGYRMEMKPEGHLLFIFNDDLPGVVGALGTTLGRNNINIADMMLSRKKEPPKAVMGISLDARPGPAVLKEIRDHEFVEAVYCVDLPELPEAERGEPPIG